MNGQRFPAIHGAVQPEDAGTRIAEACGPFRIQYCRQIYYPYDWYVFRYRAKTWLGATSTLVSCLVDARTGVCATADPFSLEHRTAGDAWMLDRQEDRDSTRELARRYADHAVRRINKALVLPAVDILESRAVYKPFWVADCILDSAATQTVLIDGVTGDFCTILDGHSRQALQEDGAPGTFDVFHSLTGATAYSQSCKSGHQDGKEHIMDVAATATEAVGRVDASAGPRRTFGRLSGKRATQSPRGSTGLRGAAARSSGDGTDAAGQHRLRARVTRVIRAACCLSGASDRPRRAQTVRTQGRPDEPAPPGATARVSSSSSPEPEKSGLRPESPRAEGSDPASAAAVAKRAAGAPGLAETVACASVNVNDESKTSAIYRALALSELQKAGFDNPKEELLKLYREQVKGPTDFDKEVWRAESTYLEQMQIGAFVKAAQELAGTDDSQFGLLCKLAPNALERSFNGGELYRQLLSQVPPFQTPSLQAYLDSFDRQDDSVHERVYKSATALASLNQ